MEIKMLSKTGFLNQLAKKKNVRCKAAASIIKIGRPYDERCLWHYYKCIPRNQTDDSALTCDKIIYYSIY